MQKNRLKHKVEIFKNIAEQVALLSVSQTTKVGCIAVKKDFTKVASIGYNGRYPGCPYNPDTDGEEKSLDPGESGFTHAEINAIAKFKEHDPENYIVIVTLSPCESCLQALLIQGFRDIYYIEEYRMLHHINEMTQHVPGLIVDQIDSLADNLYAELHFKSIKR